MFIGHFGVALAAKSAMPRVSLPVLFVASQLLDLVWPVLVLAGIERVSVEPHITAFNPLNFEYYPYSHSLVAAILLSMVFRWFYFAFTKDRRSAWLISAVVLSHWVLDWIVHRPDLPISIDNKVMMGLGLWNSIPGTILIETLLFFGGAFIYAKKFPPPTPAKRWALWGLIAFLALIFAGSAFGPQPEVGTPGAAIAGPALAMWLFIPWAWWVDSRRAAA